MRSEPQEASAGKFQSQHHIFHAAIVPFPAQSLLEPSKKILKHEALILYRNRKRFLEISVHNSVGSLRFDVFPAEPSSHKRPHLNMYSRCCHLGVEDSLCTGQYIEMRMHGFDRVQVSFSRITRHHILLCPKMLIDIL